MQVLEDSSEHLIIRKYSLDWISIIKLSNNLNFRLFPTQIVINNRGCTYFLIFDTILIVRNYSYCYQWNIKVYSHSFAIHSLVIKFTQLKFEMSPTAQDMPSTHRGGKVIKTNST